MTALLTHGATAAVCSPSAANAVTAPAMALSRHRFSVRNSSISIGESVSSAKSVIAWQMSERDTVLQFRCGRLGRRTLRDLLPTTLDELDPVGRQEIHAALRAPCRDGAASRASSHSSA